MGQNPIQMQIERQLRQSVLLHPGEQEPQLLRTHMCVSMRCSIDYLNINRKLIGLSLAISIRHMQLSNEIAF